MIFEVFSLVLLVHLTAARRMYSLHSGYTTTYLGCFRDVRNSSALSLPFIFSEEATVDWCTSYCASKRYRYAGVQYYYECRCGNEGYNRYGEGTSCNSTCAGNITQTCGGRDQNSVYEIVYTSATSTPTPFTTNTFTVSKPFTAANGDVTGKHDSQHTEDESKGDNSQYIYIGVGIAAFFICTAVVVTVILLRKRRLAFVQQQRERDSYSPKPLQQISSNQSDGGSASPLATGSSEQTLVPRSNFQNQHDDGGTYENCDIHPSVEDNGHKHALPSEVKDSSVDKVDLVENDLYGW